MSQPLVSILIPCYNSEKWLAETLESALAQTWQNIEIIIVDDGSTDNSLAIAKQFEADNVKVISQENRGASAARNRAFMESQGDFIQYLDADDLLAPNKIECQIKLLKQWHNGYLIAGKWGRFYNSTLETNFVEEAVWKNMSPVEWLVCSWEGGGMMPLHSWLISREIAEQAGEWNENLSLNDDGEYFCRVILASKGVKFCPSAKSYYRANLTNSLSSRNTKSYIESAFKSLELITNNLLTVENSNRTRHACATVFQRFVYSYFPNYPDLLAKAEQKVVYFGGSDLKISGGKGFSFISDIIGWKLAKRLQIAINHSNKSN